jgi:hypothetical protein
MHLRLTLVFLAVLLAIPSLVDAQDSRFSDGRFEVTWRVRGSAPAFRFDGEVTNRQAIDVSDIVLAVESLDATGRVTSTTVGFIDGPVSGNGSRAFSFRSSITGDAKNLRLRPVSWQTGARGF